MEEESIGDTLKRLRLEVGLSKRELGRRSGVDRVYITQIEGVRKTPRGLSPILIIPITSLIRFGSQY
jgi:transcriptional regulator with XRE-family HTH domain